jgi:hypothetical protein
MKFGRIIVPLVLSLLAITIALNIILEIYYDYKSEINYEFICKTIEENSEYYTEFADEFLNVVKAEKDIENKTLGASFHLYEIQGNIETPLNYDLIQGWEDVVYEPIEGEDVWYVILGLPYRIERFLHWFGYSDTYFQEYSVYYIPDEYITDPNLEVIFSKNCVTVDRIGNLFVVGHITNLA